MDDWEIAERARIRQDILDSEVSYADQLSRAIDDQIRQAGAGSFSDGRDEWNTRTRIEILKELMEE